MTDKTPVPKKASSADWFLRGALTRIGDTLDRLTGRRYRPSSSLATSELIERIKRLLDSEARQIPEKGTVVPHLIKLKVQWNKFSTEGDDVVKALETELLTATVDHINDSLYYTYAPVKIEVKPDYFIEGVKLTASFDEKVDVELNVTLPAINLTNELSQVDLPAQPAAFDRIARYELKGVGKEKTLRLVNGKSVSVGRTASNELMIDDASVSKMHASLTVDIEGIISVADTGSTNGTFINDERIAYGKAIRLNADDKVKFGTVEVRFEYAPDGVDKTHELAHAETVMVGDLEFSSRIPDDTPPVIEKPEQPAEDPISSEDEK